MEAATEQNVEASLLPAEELQPSYVLAFDTANEVIALGVGTLNVTTRSVTLIASQEIEAHRASNTKLIPSIEELFTKEGLSKDDIACVVCGRGPGSFTGVRIAMATAKGIASALEVPLYGVSTLDAVAWKLFDAGVRGEGVVCADAMRQEVYPVRYSLTEGGPQRLGADVVVKAAQMAEGLRASTQAWIAGDALKKHAELFKGAASFADEKLWTPTGAGLLLAAEAAWRAQEIDPFDAKKGNPSLTLPVYTRLSDAEENERIRLSKNDPKDLRTGVQEAGLRKDQIAMSNDTAIANAKADMAGVVYRPLDAAHGAEVAALEQRLMGSDAWSAALVLDELPRKDRVWWAAYAEENADQLIGYAGGWIIDGQLQILKVAVVPECQKTGIARKLLALLAADARDLGAKETLLEVRKGNKGAQAFYQALGLNKIAVRPGYYSDKEDATIMQGPLPLAANDIAGMELQVRYAEGDASKASPLDHPLILAIETSCDETAAAIVDSNGALLSDVVASQIDFHARFGGVVPEIASRKHIEAICGVTQEALDAAAQKLAVPILRWRDLDAVAVTYAPGLVGALVVGVAFAKAAAWAAGLPFIGVNHLEGHIYANKMTTPDITPPMVVSLVSGGHTMLVHVKEWGSYETLGSTLDDAVGEAFDKVAKAMGLGYPGGPIISKLALQGNPKAVNFPRAMMHSGDLQFSLSGLKTAVITYLHQEEAADRTINKADVAASFQQAVIDVQVKKAETALRQTGAHEFCLGGGVAANPALRQAYEAMCARLGVRLTLPPLSACTDNAGMIALVAHDRFAKKRFFDFSADAHAHTNLDEPY